MLYPWIAAQLVAGLAGYIAYYHDVTSPYNVLYTKYTSAPISETAAAVTAFLAPFLTSDNATGFSTTRLIGFGTTSVGVAGATLAFVKPDLFPIATYVSLLGGIGILVQSLLARGWYSSILTNTGTASVEIYDPKFLISKYILFFGGLLAVAIDSYTILMPFIPG